jgi:hypothetical protein
VTRLREMMLEELHHRNYSEITTRKYQRSNSSLLFSYDRNEAQRVPPRRKL